MAIPFRSVRWQPLVEQSDTNTSGSSATAPFRSVQALSLSSGQGQSNSSGFSASATFRSVRATSYSSSDLSIADMDSQGAPVPFVSTKADCCGAPRCVDTRPLTTVGGGCQLYGRRRPEQSERLLHRSLYLHAAPAEARVLEGSATRRNGPSRSLGSRRAATLSHR